MRRFSLGIGSAIWSSSLILVACSVFLNSFGQGVLNAASINFFVDTLGLSGGQVLWLEGIRELPGLALIFIAALTMRLPLARRTTMALVVMGLGYISYAYSRSYTALVAASLVASLGMHMWMPLHSALGLCLTTKDKSGRVLGALSSVSALATIIGMGAIALVTRLFESLPLGVYYIIGGSLIVVAGLLLVRLPTHVGSTRVVQPRMLLKCRYWLYYVLTFFEGSRKEVLGTFARLVLVQSFGTKVWEISLLLLVSSVLNFVSAPLIGYLVDHVGERRTLSLSYTVLALCCLGYATLREASILAVLLVAIKLFVMFGMGLSTYVNRIAPPEELTPTLSAGISINHVTSVAMPLLAGVLLPLIGYRGIFLGTAALIMLSVPFAAAMRVTRPAVPQAAPAIAD